MRYAREGSSPSLGTKLTFRCFHLASFDFKKAAPVNKIGAAFVSFRIIYFHIFAFAVYESVGYGVGFGVRVMILKPTGGLYVVDRQRHKELQAWDNDN